jgi:bifunctional UDP-N-acetylglucosamine pyrophosphorylase/glucosamine-1-phosphate N-acetyltransferase
VVVGDNVKTGVNTSLNPGVTLASGEWTTPGETVFRE